MKQNNKKFNNAMHKFVGVWDKYVIVRKENTTVRQMQPLINCQGLALATDVQEHNTVPGTNLGFSERHGFLAKA